MKILFRKTAAAVCAILIALTAAIFTACDGSNGNSGLEVSNLVIPIQFASGNVYEDGFEQGLEQRLNNSPTSMRSFFLAESLGKCSVTSSVADAITVSNADSYYRKKSSLAPNGYEYKTLFVKEHVDAFYREQMLVREAIKLATIPEGYVPDADGDGYVDGITFVLNTSLDSQASSHGSILWPHKSELYRHEAIEGTFYVPGGFFDGVDLQEAFEMPTIGGKAVKSYTIVFENSTDGEICHEFSHVLGLPDYYDYLDSGLTVNDNLGRYELLGTGVGEVPQYSLAYVRSKIGFIRDGEEIGIIDDSQDITLYPVTHGGVQAYKIFPEGYTQTGEYFVVEAREKIEGQFDGYVNNSGVIVYAVNERNAYYGKDGQPGAVDNGNMYGGGNFEVRMVMQGAYSWLTEVGGRNSHQSIAFSDGSPSGVSVTVTSKNADGSYGVSVDVQAPYAGTPEKPALEKTSGGCVELTWGGGKGYAYVTAFRATKDSLAALQIDCLPSSKKLIGGGAFAREMEGHDVILSKKIALQSGRCALGVTEQCCVVLVQTDEDGKVTKRDAFYIGVEGEAVPEFAFGDILRVAFRPGKPAFIVGCGLGVLFVLVGIIIVLRHKKRDE